MCTKELEPWRIDNWLAGFQGLDGPGKECSLVVGKVMEFSLENW